MRKLLLFLLGCGCCLQVAAQVGRVVKPLGRAATGKVGIEASRALQQTPPGRNVPITPIGVTPQVQFPKLDTPRMYFPSVKVSGLLLDSIHIIRMPMDSLSGGFWSPSLTKMFEMWRDSLRTDMYEYVGTSVRLGDGTYSALYPNPGMQRSHLACIGVDPKSNRVELLSVRSQTTYYCCFTLDRGDEQVCYYAPDEQFAAQFQDREPTEAELADALLFPLVVHLTHQTYAFYYQFKNQICYDYYKRVDLQSKSQPKTSETTPMIQNDSL